SPKTTATQARPSQSCLRIPVQCLWPSRSQALPPQELPTSEKLWNAESEALDAYRSSRMECSRRSQQGCESARATRQRADLTARERKMRVAWRGPRLLWPLHSGRTQAHLSGKLVPISSWI